MFRNSTTPKVLNHIFTFEDGSFKHLDDDTSLKTMKNKKKLILSNCVNYIYDFFKG